MENEGVTPEGQQPDDAPIFRDSARAAGADRATLAALSLDAVAQLDREIAQKHAHRAAILDNARVLAESAAGHVVLDSAPRSKVDELGFKSFISEMAAMLRIPESTARTQVEEAQTLQRQLPHTREALAAGDISHTHARRIIDQSWSLPRDAVAEYEQAAVPAARVQTAARFSRTARIMRERMHPESIIDRRKRAEKGRCIEFQPLQDGMAVVGVVQTADVATAIYNATVDTARGLQSDSEPRTLAQLSADVFADAIISGFVDPKPGADTPPLPITVQTGSAGKCHKDSGSDRSAQPFDSELLACAEAGLPVADFVTLGDGLRFARSPRLKRERTTWTTNQQKRQRHRAEDESDLLSRPSPDQPQHAPTGTITMDRALTLAIRQKRASAEPIAVPDGGSLTETLLTDVLNAAHSRVRACRVEAPTSLGLRSALGVGDLRRAIRPSVMVTVPVLSLLDQTADPSSLEGYGPIDAETAKALTANAPSLTRLLTHPESGAVLSVGRTSYRVPADLKRALQVRDHTCRFPGCNRKAVWCDVDHTDDWQYGGVTSMSNLAYLCRKHHTLKHSTLWSVEQDDAGVLTWTSPVGNTYKTEPDVALARGAHLAAAERLLDVESPDDPLSGYGESPPF